MPTARELLEQADALMRRNRVREEPVPAAPVVPEQEVPAPDEALPEAAPGDGDATVDEALPRREALARELAAPPPDSYPLPSSPVITSLDDIPELTDVVEEIVAESIIDVAGDFDLGEPSVFMEPGHGEVSILGPWPAPPAPQPRFSSAAAARDSAAGNEANDFDLVEIGILHVSPEFLDDDAVDGLPADATADARDPVWVDDGVAAEPISSAAAELPDPSGLAPVAAPPADEAAAGAPSPALVDESAEVSLAAAAASADLRWDQITEEIRMQVLQRIDIFTDTGLQEQLAARLQPIVDAASADLVSTINQHVGQLLRAYVAEAIEREIQQWRADNRS